MFGIKVQRKAMETRNRNEGGRGSTIYTKAGGCQHIGYSMLSVTDLQGLTTGSMAVFYVPRTPRSMAPTDLPSWRLGIGGTWEPIVRDSEPLRDHDLATVPHWEPSSERMARILQDTAQFLLGFKSDVSTGKSCRESLAEGTDFTAQCRCWLSGQSGSFCGLIFAAPHLPRAM